MSSNFSITIDTKTGRRTKGRGFQRSEDNNTNTNITYETYNEIHNDVQKSVEGYVIFITGLHEEATEDDLTNYFSEYGTIQQCHLNLDRRNGFVKGYALIEYKTYEEASEAIKNMNNATVLEQNINVSWAFKPKPLDDDGGQRRFTVRKSGGGGRRSKSPEERSRSR